jgi:peptide subunit release factor 1 (eRF1)
MSRKTKKAEAERRARRYVQIREWMRHSMTKRCDHHPVLILIQSHLYWKCYGCGCLVGEQS